MYDTSFDKMIYDTLLVGNESDEDLIPKIEYILWSAEVMYQRLSAIRELSSTGAEKLELKRLQGEQTNEQKT